MTRLTFKNTKSRRLLINLLIVLFLAGGTFVAIQFAKGYRPDLENRSLSGTGLLNITSYPESARVIINDKLTTVTDDKLYLLPGDYTIKVEKDGFHPWVKTIPLKNELVTSADARLFPIIPATSPLTFYQARNAAVNPDGSKIAYVLKDTPQDTASGIYVHSLTGNLLGSTNVQISENSPRDYSDALLVWSPDSSQILAIFTETPTIKDATERISAAYLLNTRSMNSKNLSDVTLRIPLIVSEWQDQYAKINLPILNLYPSFLTDIITDKATNVYFSPDREKVFYTSTEDISLPENQIGNILPNINSTTETRNLTAGQTYLFDIKEGTNYHLSFATTSEVSKSLITAVATPSSNLHQVRQLKAQSESQLTTNLTWYLNRHLIVTDETGVHIVDYDGTNMINITGVQPLNSFVAPSPDGSKLILLTNINQRPDTYNLISFDLK